MPPDPLFSPRPPEGFFELVDAAPEMARAYGEAGAPLNRRQPRGFDALLRAIIGQQVSIHAAAAIWRKLESGLGSVLPETVADAGAERLRSVGLSRPKVRYAQDLADAVMSGRLDLKALDRLDDAEAIGRLTAIKGIGRWTAEIYLMFSLGRPDVWPAADLALAEGARRMLALDTRPTPKEMDPIGDAWRPWRSAAAMMLWHYYRFTGGPGN